MKKHAILTAVLLVVLLLPVMACANMAMPAFPGVASTVTFEKNDVISVVNEVLDITVHGAEADISAVYRMKNTSDTAVITPAMFISPNIKNETPKVTADNKNIGYTTEKYRLSGSFDDILAVDDWKFVTAGEPTEDDVAYGDTFDAIYFELSFEPNEEYDVAVSYSYALGGYPAYDYNAKYGEIRYYLSPASYWKNFGGLTINLCLDEDMPVLKSSNLDFEKVGKRTYRFESAELPTSELKIVIDENWWQEFVGTLKSPYLLMSIVYYVPFLLIIAVIIGVVVWLTVRSIKKKKAQ